MVITLGELIVEFASNEIDCGLKKITTFSGPYPSGAPAIFINQASKVGAKTKIYGSVGNDMFGESLINRLKNDATSKDLVKNNSSAKSSADTRASVLPQPSVRKSV